MNATKQITDAMIYSVLVKLTQNWYVFIWTLFFTVLQTIQKYILQYYGDIVKQHPVDKVLVDHVVSHLWEMTQMCKMSSATALQNILLEHHKEYTAHTEKKDGRGVYPGIDTVSLTINCWQSDIKVAFRVTSVETKCRQPTYILFLLHLY